MKNKDIYYELRLRDADKMSRRKRKGLHKRIQMHARGSGYKYFRTQKAAQRWLASLPTNDTFKNYWHVQDWCLLHFDVEAGTIY